MPTSTAWGAYPVPTGPEAADVPADLMALAQALDAHTVLFADSQADRDARLSAVPAGTLVSCPVLKTTWRKLASGWETTASDTGWITTGFTYPSANWVQGNYAQYRIRSGTTEIRFSSRRAGTALVANSSGNVTDDTVINIPSAARPINRPITAMGYSSGAFVCLTVDPSGIVRIISTAPNVTIPVNNEVQLSATWLEG